MNNEKKYFFLIDYKKTKLAIKEKIDQYNNDLKQLFYKDEAAFRKEKGLTEKQTYKALTIKSSDETTLFSILEIFGGSLHRNSYTNLPPEAFRINNKAVCTQKNNHIHKRTSQRHISKLMQAGLIVEKIFRGTNASFEIVFNQNLVHFKPNSDYNFYLVELYKQMLGTNDVNPKVFKGLYSFSATLAHFPLGYTVASCRLNSTSIILLEHKINIESGIVNYDFAFPQNSSPKNQINNNFFIKDLNKESQKTCQTEDTPPIAAAPPRAEFSSTDDELGLHEDFLENQALTVKVERAEQQNKTITSGKTEDDKLWKHVLGFYAYAMAILWPERVVSPYERNKICSNIYQQFKKRLGNNPVEPSVYLFRGEFLFRILLTKKYISKNPFWNIESPTSYFEIDHQRGFNGTYSWVEKSKKMEAENKLYLTHYKTFVQTWKDYTKNPGITAYNLAIAQLGKLKKECWKEYFNQSVANLNQFSTQDVKQIWKQHYRA